jgi:hypothetical protein
MCVTNAMFWIQPHNENSVLVKTTMSLGSGKILFFELFGNRESRSRIRGATSYWQISLLFSVRPLAQEVTIKSSESLEEAAVIQPIVHRSRFVMSGSTSAARSSFTPNCWTICNFSMPTCSLGLTGCQSSRHHKFSTASAHWLHINYCRTLAPLFSGTRILILDDTLNAAVTASNSIDLAMRQSYREVQKQLHRFTLSSGFSAHPPRL